jgi:hypothetical protein
VASPPDLLEYRLCLLFSAGQLSAPVLIHWLASFKFLQYPELGVHRPPTGSLHMTVITQEALLWIWPDLILTIPGSW